MTNVDIVVYRNSKLKIGGAVWRAERSAERKFHRGRNLKVVVLIIIIGISSQNFAVNISEQKMNFVSDKRSAISTKRTAVFHLFQTC